MAVLREGQPPSQFRFANDPKTVYGVLKKLPRGTKIAVEATGSWWWFVEKARELGNEVSISHPNQTKAIAHARLRSDKVDAAAIHRGLDFYYLCYDNESYANTGFQTSASTPYGARTSTEPITPRSPHGSVHGRRDLFEIWRVQRPPHLATISAAYPLDLSEKVYRASKFTGPKLFIALSARLRRSIPNGRSMIARSAVETGIWPLKEAIHGEVTHTYVPRRFEPVEII